MTILLAIALKSLLLAGATLGMLSLFRHRSAAERSWVAHIGLLALILLALAPLAMPRWTVETPAFISSGAQAPIPVAEPIATAARADGPGAVGSNHPGSVASGYHLALTGAQAAAIFYAIPTVLLLLITMLALLRLFALRARAEVLVDGHWLSALARAQRRMGFKHGTALLTSDDLASPVSWGLMRPVILLNSRAVEATSEAEAILAHELAHVARMDWAKLLLARIATALFWFNPLVWMLAREAHQLREETADDAVLGADIVDTDYAQLLVGVARHDCPGLLLGAHGVAPSKSSLARRVARVLDSASPRRPASAMFAIAIAGGAFLVAAPLAALTTKAAPTPLDASRLPTTPLVHADAAAPAEQAPADLVHLIAQGVATSVSAVRTLAPTAEPAVSVDPAPAHMSSIPATSATAIAAADADGQRPVALSVPGGRLIASATASAAPNPDVQQLIEMKALNVSVEYLNAMRGASAALAHADLDEIVGLRSVGVTPDYVRGLAEAGLPNLSADDLEEARAVNLSPDFVRSVRASGVRANLQDMIELRTMKISPEDLRRGALRRGPNPDDPDGG